MIDSKYGPKYVRRALPLMVFMPMVLSAQLEVPLKNWTAPQYFQPNQAERESISKSGAQIQFSPTATSTTALIFVAVSPCRLVDTRGASVGFIGSTPFNGPYIPAGQTVAFPVQSSTETATTAPTPCGAIPSIAQAYSLNLTLVPHPFGNPVNFVTMWPDNGSAIPSVSTLNDSQGGVVANSAIVPAGTNSGGIKVFAYGATDVIIDMNGFYAAPTDLNSNTAIGAATLSNLTSGVDNTAVGQSALNANTTGGENTAFGFGAGVTATSANANTSGSNNTYIGYQCGASTSTQLNNSFCLGAGALFGASNTGVLGNSSVTDVYFGGTTAQAVAHALSVSLTGTSTGGTKVITANTSSANYTITVPNPPGATDTFCLLTLANCGSSSGSTPTGPAGGVLSGTYPNPGFAPIGTGTFLGNFTGVTAAPTATTLAAAKLCTWVSSPLASAIRIDNGAGCALDSVATYTSSGLNIPSGTAYLYGGAPIAMAQLALNNYYFGIAGNLTGTGSYNTATGAGALLNNTGSDNTATGSLALYNNTTGADNTATGYSALQNNTTGGDNTAAGYGALGRNTIGTENTADGSGALFFNTTGCCNTATGYSALQDNTTGAGNTASGSYALEYNTTGNNNTATGSLALYNNTTGNYNTATGYSALQNNTTGSYNTVDGYRALYSNTIGTDNTVAGYHALQNNTIGTDNTVAGYNALSANTTGTYNTATGSLALISNVTGGGNTAFGGNTLYQNQTGSSNIALGNYAGYYITGSDNIDIANDGGTVPGESNVIRIGQLPYQTSVYITGISGVGVSGSAVYVGSNGQLGVQTSSRRFKDQITDMGDRSNKLLQLRPVNFFYKPEYDDGSHLLQYGLIAEEVERVYPEMVAYDSDGQIMTVKYQMLAPMLLNEVQKQNALLQSQELQIRTQAEANQLQQEENRKLEEGNRKLEERLAALEALLLKTPTSVGGDQ